MSTFQSTHPLRGATRRSSSIPTSTRRFQSTHPLRGATAGIDVYLGLDVISIHAPLAGCDDGRYYDTWDSGSISIHAPLAGCDQRFICGLRQQGKISIHAPLAGCDERRDPGRDDQPISIHAPLAGCDPPPRLRLPRPSISIHAPLAGCDPGTSPATDGGMTFQSTHPLRGATQLVDGLRLGARFQSTHPLRGATCHLTEREKA